MPSENCRIRFEVWAARGGYSVAMEGENYKDWATRQVWAVWKAAWLEAAMLQQIT